MRSFVIVLSLIFCIPIVSVADTEFEDNVPIEVVKALFGLTPNGEVKLYSDLVSGFPEIQIPDGFEIIGSINRGYSLSAVFATDSSEDQVDSQVESAISAAQYVPFPSPQPQRAATGFMYAEQAIRPDYNRYCHNSLGHLSYTFLELGTRNMVTLSSSFPSDRSSCEQQIAQQEEIYNNMRGSGNRFQALLPRLIVPQDEPRRFSPFRSSGLSSHNSNGVETSSSMVAEMELDEVYQYFKTQIEDQGWSLDSETVGRASASGTWTKSPEPELNLIGTLSVIQSEDDNYDLRFQLVSAGQRSNSRSRVFAN